MESSEFEAFQWIWLLPSQRSLFVMFISAVSFWIQHLNDNVNISVLKITIIPKSKPDCPVKKTNKWPGGADLFAHALTFEDLTIWVNVYRQRPGRPSEIKCLIDLCSSFLYMVEASRTNVSHQTFELVWLHSNNFTQNSLSVKMYINNVFVCLDRVKDDWWMGPRTECHANVIIWITIISDIRGESICHR